MVSVNSKMFVLGAAMVLGLGAASAQAATTLELDLNTLTAQTSGGAFSETYTGVITLSKGTVAPVGVLAGAELDNVGVSAAVLAGTSLSAVNGTIVLNNGAVVSGNMSVSVNGGADTYSFLLAPDINSKVGKFSSTNFFISSPTAGGSFTDSSFGLIDVSSFPGNSLSGLLFQFNFNPNASGVDSNVDVDLSVNAPSGVPIPLPAAVWGGFALMGAMGGVRLIRRRARSA